MRTSSLARTRTRLRLAAAAAAVGLIAGCGSDAGDDEAGEDEAVSYSFAMGSSGAAGAFYQAAMERNNEDNGFDGEWVELTGSEVAVAGIASNEFQFGAGVAATVMAAQQEQSAELTFIGDFVRMFWTLTSNSNLTSCEDLDGVRFGLHSPGGVSTAIFNAWFAENCPDGVEPEILYVEGSPNRYQGLLAGQLDATMLELDDVLDLPDNLHVMVNFAEDLPQIESNTVYANDEFLQEHPEVAEGLLKAMSDLAREIQDDPAIFADIIAEYRPELADQSEAIAEAYVNADVFAPEGGMSYEDLAETIELYEVAGAIQPGLVAEEIADRQYLEAAVPQGD